MGALRLTANCTPMMRTLPIRFVITLSCQLSTSAIAIVLRFDSRWLCTIRSTTIRCQCVQCLQRQGWNKEGIRRNLWDARGRIFDLSAFEHAVVNMESHLWEWHMDCKHSGEVFPQSNHDRMTRSILMRMGKLSHKCLCVPSFRSRTD